MPPTCSLGVRPSFVFGLPLGHFFFCISLLHLHFQPNEEFEDEIWVSKKTLRRLGESEDAADSALCGK